MVLGALGGPGLVGENQTAPEGSGHALKAGEQLLKQGLAEVVDALEVDGAVEGVERGSGAA